MQHNPLVLPDEHGRKDHFTYRGVLIRRESSAPGWSYWRTAYRVNDGTGTDHVLRAGTQKMLLEEIDAALRNRAS